MKTKLETLEEMLEQLIQEEIAYIKEANVSSNIAGYTGPLIVLSKKNFIKRMKDMGYEVTSNKADNSLTPFKAVYSCDPEKNKTKQIINTATKLRKKRGFTQLGLSYDMKSGGKKTKEKTKITERKFY